MHELLLARHCTVNFMTLNGCLLLFLGSAYVFSETRDAHILHAYRSLWLAGICTCGRLCVCAVCVSLVGG
jgi:hypothetical protein